MKLPKRIKVLWDWWTVQVLPNDPDDLDCLGETKAEQRRILLYSAAHATHPGRGCIQQTLLHEVLHAALATSSCSAFVAGGKEEVLVTQLEAALWPLIDSGIFRRSSK